MVALALASAAVVFGCTPKDPPPAMADPETTPTLVSHNLTVINSMNGQRRYRMETPLAERYEEATEPFTEFRQGIKVETFDSLLQIDSDIIADYAHYNEVTELWTARGHVVIKSYKRDRVVYTERMYWNQKSGRIYNDTVAKVVDGGSVHIGWNFDANQEFTEWRFYNTSGQVEVDDNPTQPSDSITSDPQETAPVSAPPPPAVTRGRAPSSGFSPAATHREEPAPVKPAARPAPIGSAQDPAVRAAVPPLPEENIVIQ